MLLDIKELGFKVNPYDTCVAKRVVNGSQLKICWHVDDLFVTHGDLNVNGELVRWFDQKYGNRTSLSVQRGKQHEYLVMDLDFSIHLPFCSLTNLSSEDKK